MLKKLGVMTVGVAAGLVAAAPFASAAEEAPAQTHESAGAAGATSNSPALQAPVGGSELPSLVGTPALDGGDFGGLLQSNGQSLSGNGTTVNGQDVALGS